LSPNIGEFPLGLYRLTTHTHHVVMAWYLNQAAVVSLYRTAVGLCHYAF